MLTDPVAARIAAFLAEIGIPFEAGEVAGDSFLPGLTVRRGRLIVDEARLAYPGDLLHEAGHLAVVPAPARAVMGEGVDVPGVDMLRLEAGVLPWSYAAALAIGLHPGVVFHAGGYAGRAIALLRTYEAGVYPGAQLLEAAGLTAVTPARAQALGVPPFPHMLRWLRED